MEISDNTLILILGFGVLVLLYLISCRKEGFFYVDPFASDYVYSKSTLDNPYNLNYNQPKRGVPVEDSTPDHKYPGFTGYDSQPSCDYGY